jgi:hypothetical protein
VLQVTGLQNRLVISLPEARHELRTTRFFLAIRGGQRNATSVRVEKRSIDGPDGHDAFGLLYFRQDQVSFSRNLFDRNK